LWLPLTLLLTASISAMGDVLQLHAKLLATSRALAQLKELQLWWSSLEQDDPRRDSKRLRLAYGTRKDNFSFGLLVDGVETATLAGLGTGVPYASRKVTPWRAEDERTRQEILEKKKGKTNSKSEAAEKKFEEAEGLREQNTDLETEKARLRKKLREEKVKVRAAEKSFDDLQAKTDRRYRQIQLQLQRKQEELEEKERQLQEVQSIKRRTGASTDERANEQPQHRRWADEDDWDTLREHGKQTDCITLGYGTEKAWANRDFRGRQNWDALSTEQQLAANRLGLYKSDFGVGTTTEHYAEARQKVASHRRKHHAYASQ
jgi:hypothetical protein